MASRRHDDESDEDEATALDLQALPRPAHKRSTPSIPSAPSTLPPTAGAPVARPARPATPRLTAGPDDDEEATEFLALRPGVAPPRAPPVTSSLLAEVSTPTLRARGRAVSLQDAPGVGSGPQPIAPSSPPAPVDDGAARRSARRDRTEPLLDLERVGARPLPVRSESDLSESGTASVPRVTRLRMRDPSSDDDEAVRSRGEHRGLGQFDTEATSSEGIVAPRADRASRKPAPRSESQTAPVPLQGSETSELADGTLVVDAPPDAIVFVNGIERGRGTIRVTSLDRHARHAVRVQASGFMPWSGAVSLEGKPAAKVRPTLKPRAR